ncbi:hypothetical protein PIB30_080529 [Stylosanthes scabra]|uniref:Uncharacterized protein n=1 Tax=Stylosanthes scabra TaxID=79078 RepID=A0ABU6ZQ47_9FABA|nr:hypothetical protein [Stylosanthes scabra]
MRQMSQKSNRFEVYMLVLKGCEDRLEKNEERKLAEQGMEFRSISAQSPMHRHGSWRLGVLQPDPTTPRQSLIKSRRGQQLCLSTLRRGNPRICVDRHSSALEASMAHA